VVQAYSRSIRGLDEVFRRLSFGCNGGRHPNSSTAVCIGLILNYFDRTVDTRILPEALKAEELQGSIWEVRRYPHTTMLHDYLIRRCHLEPGTFGCWGKDAISKFKQHWQAKPWTPGVIVRGTFGGFGKDGAWTLIKQEIDASRPAMITVPRRAAKTLQGRWHSMVVCGYRITPFGHRELLVHTGRYGDSVKGSRAQVFYISLEKVLCSYRFDVGLLSTGF
jgi:hypothetical protein